eukprot:scaffold32423_cov140-Isochrysis_galbana.AAC.5
MSVSHASRHNCRVRCIAAQGGPRHPLLDSDVQLLGKHNEREGNGELAELRQALRPEVSICEQPGAVGSCVMR